MGVGESLGKPEMISSHSIVPSSASYSSILSHLFSLSLFSNLTIKLSGLPLLVDPELMARVCAYYDRYKRPYQGTGFTPSLQASNGADPSPDETTQTEETSSTDRADGDLAWRELKKRMKFYLEPILEAFGDHRIMYSSDFPGQSSRTFVFLDFWSSLAICATGSAHSVLCTTVFFCSYSFRGTVWNGRG